MRPAGPAHRAQKPTISVVRSTDDGISSVTLEPIPFDVHGP